MTNLFTAIMTRFNAVDGDGNHNAFFNDVQGKLFREQAPEGTDYPYAVFFIVSSNPERTFTEYYQRTLLQISLFSLLQNDVSGEIEKMYSDLKALFDEQPLTITGETLIWMRETNLTGMIDEVETPAGTLGVRHWAVEFEILTSLN